MRDFAKRVSCAAHSRTWLTEPGADCSSSLNSVWIESIASTPSLAREPTTREHGLDAGLREHVERRVADAETLRAKADLLERLLARDIAGRHRGARFARARSSSVDLPMPGSPPMQHDAARHEPAAEHAVELAEARRQALDGARRRRDRDA